MKHWSKLTIAIVLFNFAMTTLLISMDGGEYVEIPSMEDETFADMNERHEQEQLHLNRNLAKKRELLLEEHTKKRQRLVDQNIDPEKSKQGIELEQHYNTTVSYFDDHSLKLRRNLNEAQHQQKAEKIKHVVDAMQTSFQQAAQRGQVDPFHDESISEQLRAIEGLLKQTEYLSDENRDFLKQRVLDLSTRKVAQSLVTGDVADKVQRLKKSRSNLEIDELMKNILKGLRKGVKQVFTDLAKKTAKASSLKKVRVKKVPISRYKHTIYSKTDKKDKNAQRVY